MILLRIVLALGLLGGLIFAGVRIYRRLPADSPAGAATDRGAKASLTIIVNSRIASAQLHSPLELSQFDLVAARREIESSPQIAKRLDDYLMRRMHDVTPVKVDVNGDGRAVVPVSAGHWWLRAFASLDTGESVEWRLPFVVVGRDRVVELTLEN